MTLAKFLKYSFTVVVLASMSRTAMANTIDIGTWANMAHPEQPEEVRSVAQLIFNGSVGALISTYESRPTLAPFFCSSRAAGLTGQQMYDQFITYLNRFPPQPQVRQAPLGIFVSNWLEDDFPLSACSV